MEGWSQVVLIWEPGGARFSPRPHLWWTCGRFHAGFDKDRRRSLIGLAVCLVINIPVGQCAILQPADNRRVVLLQGTVDLSKLDRLNLYGSLI